MATWPLALPQSPQHASLAEEFGYPVIQAPVDGPPLARRAYTAAPDNVRHSYFMTNAQLDIFEDWYRNEIAHGALPYTAPGRRGIGTATYRIVEAPRVQRHGIGWIVGMSLTRMVGVGGPVSLSPPVITGDWTIGGTLTLTPGQWSGSGTTLTHQWLRDGEPIAGATGLNYELTDGDDRHFITARETASNSLGSGSVLANGGQEFLTEWSVAARAVIDEMDPKPVNSQQEEAIYACVKGLFACEYWGKALCIGLFKSFSEQAATINWKDPQGPKIQLVNNVSFAPYASFSGDGVSGHIQGNMILAGRVPDSNEMHMFTSMSSVRRAVFAFTPNGDDGRIGIQNDSQWRAGVASGVSTWTPGGNSLWIASPESAVGSPSLARVYNTSGSVIGTPTASVVTSNSLNPTVAHMFRASANYTSGNCVRWLWGYGPGSFVDAGMRSAVQAVISAYESAMVAP